MKNKTVKALATLLAVTTVSMMGTAGVMASDNTAEDTATEAADLRGAVSTVRQ